MDKNTITALLLIAAIFIGYNLLRPKPDIPPPSTPTNTTDSLSRESNKETYFEDLNDPSENEELTTSSGLSDSLKEIQAKRKYGVFSDLTEGIEEFTTLENNDLKITFSNKGGRIYKVELKEYQTFDSLPLILFEGEDKTSNFQLNIKNARKVNTKDLYFIPTINYDNKSVTFRAPISPDKYIEQSYKLNDEGYEVDYNLNLIGLNDILPKSGNIIHFSTSQKIRKLEQSSTNESRYSNLYYSHSNGETEDLSNTSAEEEKIINRVEWVSFKQQFFNTTIINKNDSELGFKQGSVSSSPIENNDDYIQQYSANLALNYGFKPVENYQFQYYFGPNHYQTLKKYEIGLENIISLGWFGFINKWIIIPIFNFLEKYISNYGLIILLLTLVIKLALSPLTYKSYVSTAKMKVLKPELDELKEKYKDDQQKFSSEQMKLYQKAGVSPLGGCLPMMLQMPILISMYYLFPSSIELRQEAFLWASDLSTYDSILSIPDIPFYGDHVSLFTLLMAASQLLQVLVTPQQMGGGNQMAGMKYMPYIMPVFMMFIFNSFPAGLTYYYFLANMITFGQQLVIKRFIIDEDKLHKQMQENKKRTPKKSGWMARLEDMQKQQQTAQKGKKKKK